LDGNNHPAGVAIMVENNTSGVVVEDVDCVHQGNGMFATYDGSNNNVYRRCRMRDQIMSNQGRGKPSSDGGAGPVVLVASDTTSGTRFEQNVRWNVNENNLAWVATNMAVDWVKQDFTPRAPIRNKFGWT
jgi:hypothetical protein